LRNQEEPGAPTANILKQTTEYKYRIAKQRKKRRKRAGRGRSRSRGRDQGTEKERKKSLRITNERWHGCMTREATAALCDSRK